jgi:hypothetical protein
MAWIDSVRSLTHQATNVTASSTANRIVEVCSGTPRSSTSLSLSSVPTTLISTTASQ